MTRNPLLCWWCKLKIAFKWAKKTEETWVVKNLCLLLMNVVEIYIWFVFVFVFVVACELLNAFDTNRFHVRNEKFIFDLFCTNATHWRLCEQPNNTKHQLKNQSKSTHSGTIALAIVFFCYFGESNASQLHRQNRCVFFCLFLFCASEQ